MGAKPGVHIAGAGALRSSAHLGRMGLQRFAAASLVISLLSGCGGLDRVAPAPPTLANQVTVLGIPNARFWADQGEGLVAEGIAALERERAATGGASRAGRLPPAHLLALSGGSDNGAFGAGLLCGWSDSGTIPKFKLVTGVSTGAMIAPLAFLGAPYVDRLRTLYTTITRDDILEKRGLFGAVFGESLADTTPLFRLISRYVDERMLADIAREYNSGRLLLIGTTSLDEQRPIIWNIGAIAASGQPGSLELVRKILLASASIPGAFPPVMLDVEAGGRRYQEMNVDGGAVVQTFLYPPDIGQRVDLRSGEHARERHAYIIRNGRLDPDWSSVDRRFLTIAGRAISTMIHYSGYNDILRIYATTKRDGVDYNLAYIETDFPQVKHEEFDASYLRALFDYGYAKGRSGHPWRKTPPILEASARPEPQSSSYPAAQQQPAGYAYAQPQPAAYGYAQPRQYAPYAYAEPQHAPYAYSQQGRAGYAYAPPQPTAHSYAQPQPPPYAYAQPQPAPYAATQAESAAVYAQPSYAYGSTSSGYYYRATSPVNRYGEARARYGYGG